LLILVLSLSSTMLACELKNKDESSTLEDFKLSTPQLIVEENPLGEFTIKDDDGTDITVSIGNEYSEGTTFDWTLKHNDVEVQLPTDSNTFEYKETYLVDRSDNRSQLRVHYVGENKDGENVLVFTAKAKHIGKQDSDVATKDIKVVVNPATLRVVSLSLGSVQRAVINNKKQTINKNSVILF